MPDTELNSTAAALLGLLHERAMTGGELVAAADARFGPFWSMTRSQVYRELPKLAAAGYVRLGKPGPRAAQPYSITSAGKRAFARWLGERPGTDHPRNPLLLRASFGAQQSAGQRAALLQEGRSQHEQRLGALREQLKDKGLDPYVRATLDFSVSYERALLKWIDAAEKA
jgi:DNA-binding PadR family transcriptional regulator